MATSDQIRMDPDRLYREESYTDLKTGTLRRLIPVTAEGLPDPSRPERFLGQVTVLTPLGSLPVSFEIEASNLKEAVERYGAAAERAIQETAEEIRRLQQEQSRSIVIPKGGLGDLGGGGVPGSGGIPGGGLKI